MRSLVPPPSLFSPSWPPDRCTCRAAPVATTEGNCSFSSARRSVTELVLDLRMKGVSRSDTPDKQGDETSSSSSAHQTIPLDPTADRQRGWDLRCCLISSAGKSVLETRGEAKLQNFVEVLPVQVNLADLAPGMYQLRLRRAQTQWISYFNLARVSRKQCNASAVNFLTSLEDICSSRENKQFMRREGSVN